MRFIRRWMRRAVVLAVVAAVVAGVWLDRRVRAYLAGPALGEARVWAAPAVLRPGARVPGGSLPRVLARLGFRPAPGGGLAPGEYRVAGGVVELLPPPSPSPWAVTPGRVRVTLAGDVVKDLRDSRGERLALYELPPEQLAVLGRHGPALGSGGEAAPPVCRAAVLAAEDQHFFLHPGIDPLAVARALWTNVRTGSRRQGGSTITQQLVKNAFLSPRRTVPRKIEEAALALLVELHASKQEILRRYLASVYLGVDGGLPVHGFAQAAETYFDEPLGQLGAAECALLAGIIRAPNGLAPRRHAAAARARRNQVLALMVEDGSLDRAAAAQAARAPIRLAAPRARPVAALYVAAEVQRELARALPPRIAGAPGLSIFTSIDPDLQRDAERAVRRGLAGLERGRRGEPLEAALLALDPANGRVRALVGGRHYGSSPLDRAFRARRQPGSAFKPFVYLAALDPARVGRHEVKTVVSPVEDTPISLRVGGRLWQPVNYDGRFDGRLALEDAIADSRNAATVRLALDVGLERMVDAAADLGVASPRPVVPALALGAGETSLLDLTAAYGVFASGGLRRPPRLIVGVTSATGEVVYAPPFEERRVLSPGVAYLVTHLLERVVDAGTGRGARRAGLQGAAAGKTGTTDRDRDAWFIGFTPQIVAGVWVGRDSGGPTGLTGAAAALPIWTDFVRAAARGTPVAAFPVPDDIVWRDVDPETGLLATASCPAHRREPFLAGTEPTRSCVHRAPVITAVGDRLNDAVERGGRAVERGGWRLREWLGRLFH
jgi:penicillin-binding protein 1B